MPTTTDASAEPTTKLTRRDITKLGFRSALLQSGFNYERMQATGFASAQAPLLKKIYGNDKAALSAAMKDNLEFINTNTNAVGFLMGLLISLEERHESRDLIKGLKVALFGPLAGIGDAIFWFTLLPIVAGVCASFASQGSILGPIIFFVVYLALFLLRVVWTHLGYTLGVKAIDKLRASSGAISRAATILGVTVVGGLIASYVHITVAAKVAVTAGHEVSIQEAFFDKVFPNLLPMVYTLLMYYLLRAKKVSPVTLILVTFVLSIALSWLGVL
ncbi:PTS N-acetylgalactosamine transporter subunit IID [Yersinia intermedia]|uniref:PTS N-acetylgalactosamine transporter subunit IID n=1 Tax=Yersinia intermedia TaxID=631 RepID=A0ABX6FET8_YERIN|nr:N-acetylgalactosamine permease IID component [Yersinia intermedia ATCC 29909]QGR68504.1 PTS N-acetylgalactosamine transporter subunit IID [Yersinia intermedia]QGR72966.1 PTS N-acetylgalactosamine transporter subunit IID [Yersinia intermedia]